MNWYLNADSWLYKSKRNIFLSMALALSTFCKDLLSHSPFLPPPPTSLLISLFLFDSVFSIFLSWIYNSILVRRHDIFLYFLSAHFLSIYFHLHLSKIMLLHLKIMVMNIWYIAKNANKNEMNVGWQRDKVWKNGHVNPVNGKSDDRGGKINGKGEDGRENN